ncbi:hypothetical protein ACTFIR_003578 [Dictyostelium discoideum]
MKKSIRTSIFKILIDILEGVISLREDGIFHRDFKTANFLVFDSGKILICDFGTSRDENEKRVNTFAKTMVHCGTDVQDWENLVCVAITGSYVSPKIAYFKMKLIFQFGLTRITDFHF